MPASFGGETADHNLAAACFFCNRSRQRDLTWVLWAEHRGDPAKMSPSQRIVFRKGGKAA